MAERKPVVLVGGRDESLATDLRDDRGDVVRSARRTRGGDEQRDRRRDRVRFRHQDPDRRIADEAVQAVAAQENTVALAQLDDRQ